MPANSPAYTDHEKLQHKRFSVHYCACFPVECTYWPKYLWLLLLLLLYEICSLQHVNTLHT